MTTDNPDTATNNEPKPMSGLIDDLREKKERLRQGGGEKRLAKQKEQGKLSARERIDELVDPESFEEFGLFAQHRQVNFGMAGKEAPADGVVTGAGSVDAPAPVRAGMTPTEPIVIRILST